MNMINMNKGFYIAGTYELFILYIETNIVVNQREEVEMPANSILTKRRSEEPIKSGSKKKKEDAIKWEKVSTTNSK